METGLHERDRAGVQDFVLLENYESETAFIDNLKKRFQENLIYVSFKYTMSFLDPSLPISLSHYFSIICNCLYLYLYFVTLTTHPLL